MKVKIWLVGLVFSASLVLVIYALPAITANFSVLKGSGRPVPASVLQVIDAQTLLVRFKNRKEICVVLNGINTPLKQQLGYRRSVLGMIDLVQGDFRNELLVQVDAVLNSKVWLVSIYDLQEEVLGNLALIRFGYAWPDNYLSEDSALTAHYLGEAKTALEEAKQNTRGHWAGINIGELPHKPPQSYLTQVQTLGHSSEQCKP